MSVEKAHELVRRTLTDQEFADRLTAVNSDEQRREIIEQEGFGDVRQRHLNMALPQSAGGELSDEEFIAVAGGSGFTALDAVAALDPLAGCLRD